MDGGQEAVLGGLRFAGNNGRTLGLGGYRRLELDLARLPGVGGAYHWCRSVDVDEIVVKFRAKRRTSGWRT